MGFDEEAVTDEQREACAVVVMRTMLEDWCDDTGVPANGQKAPTTFASCGSRSGGTAS